MELEYVFHDAASGVIFESPENINDVFANSEEMLFSLKADNSMGKSWLMTFIISSLIEYPDRHVDSQFLVMTEELLEKIQQLRKSSAGLIKGAIRIKLGELIVKVKYELEKEKPIRTFALTSNPQDWSDLDDSILAQHARFCYLIPENPTKRIEGIRLNIKALLTAIGTAEIQRQNQLKNDWRSCTDAIRDEELIEELGTKISEVTEKRDNNLLELEKLEEENIQSEVIDKLGELRSGLEEVSRLDAEMKQLKEELKQMPDVISNEQEDKVIAGRTAAHREVKDSELAKLLKRISLLGDESSNGFSDVQNAYLSAVPEALQIARLSDSFENREFNMIPFINKEPKSLSKFKQMLLSSSLEMKVKDFFKKKFSIADSEREGLEAVKELISWLERRTAVVDNLLRDKLQLKVSGSRLLQLLKDEETKMVEQEKLSKLEASIEAIFSKMKGAIDEFVIIEKSYARAEKAYKKMERGLSHDVRTLQIKRKGDYRSLQVQHGQLTNSISNVEGFIKRHSPELKTGGVKELTQSIALLKRNLRVASKDARSRLDKAKSKNHELNSQLGNLEGKLRFESDKRPGILSSDEIEKMRPYMGLMDDYARFSVEARKRFEEKTATGTGNNIRELFGEVARNQLGGEILFHGVKRELMSVDFNTKSLVFKDDSGEIKSLPWHRLSTGNSAALFLNSTLHNIIQQGKKIIALIDEVGDMSEKSRDLAFKSVRDNSSQFALFFTAEVINEEEFKIEKL